MKETWPIGVAIIILLVLVAIGVVVLFGNVTSFVLWLPDYIKEQDGDDQFNISKSPILIQPGIHLAKAVGKSWRNWRQKTVQRRVSMTNEEKTDVGFIHVIIVYFSFCLFPFGFMGLFCVVHFYYHEMNSIWALLGFLVLLYPGGKFARFVNSKITKASA